MLTVEFYECSEMRMGSPFKGCRIRISGEWSPALPSDCVWQDIMAQNPTGRYTALVYWDTQQNEPGFRVAVLDAEQRTISPSARIEGCCQRLWWEAGEFKWCAMRVVTGSVACEVVSD